MVYEVLCRANLSPYPRRICICIGETRPLARAGGGKRTAFFDHPLYSHLVELTSTRSCQLENQRGETFVVSTALTSTAAGVDVETQATWNGGCCLTV